ncbi:MAG: thioredoxin family protein [Planctomycetaceae bacterium]|nr:thioredoxin family protein [Planctomycetaceae bacterium]
MKSSSVCLLFALAIGCAAFSGCSTAETSQTEQRAEEANQPVSFLTDLHAGRELAQKKKKPMLLFFSVPDNIGGQRMMETTFRDDEIKRLAEWLVCVYVDGSEERELCELLNISSFPTIILSHADGTEVCRLEGRQTPDQLAVQIHMLLQVIASRPQMFPSAEHPRGRNL